jgi:hypothetical protein
MKTIYKVLLGVWVLLNVVSSLFVYYQLNESSDYTNSVYKDCLLLNSSIEKFINNTETTERFIKQKLEMEKLKEEIIKTNLTLTKKIEEKKENISIIIHYEHDTPKLSEPYLEKELLKLPTGHSVYPYTSVSFN